MSLISENPYVNNEDIQRIISLSPNHDIIGIYVNSQIPQGLICMDILYGVDNKNRDVPILRCPSQILKCSLDKKENILNYLICESICRIPSSLIKGIIKLRFRYHVGFPITFPIITIKTEPVNAIKNTLDIIPIKIYHIDCKKSLKYTTQLTSYYSEIYRHIHKKDSPIHESNSTNELFSVFPVLSNDYNNSITTQNWYVTLTELWIFENNVFAPSYTN